MGLPNATSKALRKQADGLVAEIKKIEEPIEKLAGERDALQDKIDQIQATTRELKEAVNILVRLFGEENLYDIPKAKETAAYLKPGRWRFEKICASCGETAYVAHHRKACPFDGCDGRLDKPDSGPEPEDEPDRQDDAEEELESDDDIKHDLEDDNDEEPECSDPPMPVDESWRRPGEGTVKKGCNRCNRVVHVLPHCTICPDELCRGHLVDTKK